MNIGKAFGVAMLPLAGVVIIEAVAGLIRVIPVLNLLTICLGCPVWILQLALLGYAGYSIGKAKLEITDSAVVGALTGFVASVLAGAIAFLATMLGLGVNVAMNQDFLSSVFGAGLGVIGIIIGIIGWTIIGAVVVVIGHVASGSSNSPAKPVEQAAQPIQKQPASTKQPAPSKPVKPVKK